mgnify:CR=1 FL=1
MVDVKQVADAADMIVNGYAFTRCAEDQGIRSSSFEGSIFPFSSLRFSSFARMYRK